MALNPLSRALNNTAYVYKITSSINKQNIVNHRMYMDDTKLYASSISHLHNLLDITVHFSNAISMELGNEKTKSVHLIRGKINTTDGILLNQQEIIQDLTEEERYIYLGILQLKGTNHAELKNIIKQRFLLRVRSILKSHLYTTNKVKAINSFPILVLTYYFGILKWKKLA